MTVPKAVQKAIPSIEKFINQILPKMKKGGRLFYIGSGTSGRLGIVDASECPPTYGVPFGLVVGIIAGGDKAIRKAVEFAEDSTTQGWKDLEKHSINRKDTVLGISSSGTTPYVVGALEKCRKKGITTGALACNPGSPIIKLADFPILVVVGPEFVTGSTRMKSGTAQKLVLNMLSTSLMIKLGRIRGSKMVDMLLSNYKLIDRGTRILIDELDLDYKRANKILMNAGSVRSALKKNRKK